MHLAESLSPALGGDEELLTEQQVSQEFGIPKKTLQAKRLSGGGPEFAKIGAAVRYQRRAIRQFIAKHTVNSTSEVATRIIRPSSIDVDSSDATRRDGVVTRTVCHASGRSLGDP